MFLWFVWDTNGKTAQELASFPPPSLKTKSSWPALDGTEVVGLARLSGAASDLRVGGPGSAARGLGWGPVESVCFGEKERVPSRAPAERFFFTQ